MLAVEQRLLATLTTQGTWPPLPTGFVEAAITGRPTLGDDQAAAVRTLCAGTGAVGVLVGPAGTGKTFTLDTVRDAYQRAGIDVIGAAPSARAAIELHSGANIPARTMHSLLAAWERGLEQPGPATLLVIDEAGMADVRILERTINRVHRVGGRVILVGDHHQLPEIDAGGGFAAASTRTTTVAELTINRRQHQPWEQAALSELRAGNVTVAVRAYLDHDRVIVAVDRQQMVDAAIDTWFEARRTGRHVVLLAGTNELVDVLNEAARHRLVVEGELPGEVDGHYGHRSYRIGERVVLRRNSDRARTLDAQQITVANGQTGTVTHVDHDSLTIQRDHDDAFITVDRRYLDAGGRVDHAYALTTTRAQGGTWDQAITVGLDGLYREAAYVDLSRGGQTNWLIITQPEAEQVDLLARDPLARHDQSGIPLPSEEHGQLDDELVNTFERSGAKQLAHTIDADVAIVDQLAQQPLDQLEHRLQHARTIERQASERIGIDVNQLHKALTRATHTAHHATIGQQVKALDRHNIGNVIGLDDASGEILIGFVSAGGREAERSLPWRDIEILDLHPTTRALPDPARWHLDQLHAVAEAAIEQWTRYLAEHGVTPGESDHTQRAIRRVIEQATNRLLADPPEWLIDLIGYQPADPIGTQTWNAAVRDIATCRTRHHVADDSDGLGTSPTDAGMQAEWATLNTHLVHLRAWLDRHDRPQVTWPHRRSHRELVTRRDELDQIFDTAPADQNHLITRLRRGDPQLLDDAAATLEVAVDAQHLRRQWILEHWPHIIEYAEISQTLNNRMWGPDTSTLLDDLSPRAVGNLATAIANDEAWLPIAASRVASQWTTSLTDQTADYLHDIADYRQRWNITNRQPLGPTPIDPDQLSGYQQLLDRLESDDLSRTMSTPSIAEYLDNQLRELAITGSSTGDEISLPPFVETGTERG
jgi:predicted transcriptional regulator